MATIRGYEMFSRYSNGVRITREGVHLENGEVFTIETRRVIGTTDETVTVTHQNLPGDVETASTVEAFQAATS